MFDSIKDALGSIGSPEKIKQHLEKPVLTIEGGLINLAAVLLNEYMENPTGKVAISVQNLFIRLKDKTDPMFKDVGLAERIVLLNLVKVIEKGREHYGQGKADPSDSSDSSGG